MPAPKRNPRTGTFTEMCRSASSFGETNDCAVKAVAIAAKVSYDKAHNMLAAAGRQSRRGTYMFHTKEVMKLLGFRMVEVDAQHFISKYPKPHCNVLKSVTTHHADRFNKAWADGCTYLMVTAGHILAIVDGVNHDWTRGTARPAQTIYRVERI